MNEITELVVVGSLNMDLIMRAPRVPDAGETILGGEFSTAPGGKGANQAVAAARLGGKVAMVGRVGQDAFGRTLVDGLERDQIRTEWVRTDPGISSGTALILLEHGGENRIIVASGANMKLTPQDMDTSATVIRNAKYLITQLEIPVETVSRAIEIAKSAQAGVILNPAPAQPLPQELLRQVDVLIPNAGEAALLAGLPKGTDPKTAADRLLEMGSRAVVITLGGKGALVASKEGKEIVPPFKTSVVDTTAAGDAFVGGLSVALAEGQSLREAVRWGNAAGALAVTRLGAQPSLPTREELFNRLKTEG